jgi:hypothetical protein
MTSGSREENASKRRSLARYLTIGPSGTLWLMKNGVETEIPTPRQ